ncbi:hypothetical protein D3C83_156130 [compost metagenome]
MHLPHQVGQKYEGAFEHGHQMNRRIAVVAPDLDGELTDARLNLWLADQDFTWHCRLRLRWGPRA